MKLNTVLLSHTYTLNPSDNGGEQVSITTTFFHNGDRPVTRDTIYTNQRIEMQSYSNAASLFTTTATLTPGLLRDLANQLDEAMSEVIIKLNNENL